MPQIRRYELADWPAVWPILQSIIAAGETFVFAPTATEEEIHKAWIETALATYVACSDDGTVLGTYYLKPHQPGLGSHVGNCGYGVSEQARGQGIASAMCQHSQDEARSQGFRAIQFNFVVSTNVGAVRLWRKHGFNVVGTLPGVFQHRSLGFVDALVMFKQL